MSLDLYIRLQSTIELCQRNLARYLGAASYTHSYTAEQKKYKLELNPDIFSLPHSLEQDRFILVKSTLKNSGLTAYRISNVLKIIDDLGLMLSEASHEIDAETLEECYKKIRSKLQSGLQKNNRDSVLHSKSHCSLQQCQLSRFGFFATLWHVTIFQSRASLAFEKSIKYMDKMLAEFSSPLLLDLQMPNVPAFAANL
jgi:hypothetical protein